MKTEIQTLLETYEANWIAVNTSETLEELRDSYLQSESSREETLNWIFENVSEEEQPEYFDRFAEFEGDLIDLPIFDESFDIFESFDKFDSYYQRYGCLTPEFVLSWDDTNVLFMDETGTNAEIIKRPDVLMGDMD